MRFPTPPLILLSAASSSPPPSSVPDIVFKANAATKWIVTAAQTGAVITRRDLIAPYIVVGSIGAAFATKALKKAINQQRPDGAPFTDPGMPSSHALVATFAAAAWALTARDYAPLLIAAAAYVSILRVVTGYHTWAQVGVGAGLGAMWATLWMQLGRWVSVRHMLAPRAAFALVYGTYLCGSALFVGLKMREWTTDY